jgi:enolase-phosphatase E1
MIQAIVTDIEGTTSSLSFVKDVLFPYARTHLADFVRQHQQDEAVRILLDDVSIIVGTPLDIEQSIDQLVAWIDADQKITPLKSLQGLIWNAGYQNGDFKGHVYADAVQALQQWHQQGLALYVYSSGSVQAQKLLFGYSEAGDLTSVFSGYFDTHIGGKRELASYQRIAEEIAVQPENILFLSDIVEELDAARQAGFDTRWLIRETAIPAQAAHVAVANFDAIRFD